MCWTINKKKRFSFKFFLFFLDFHRSRTFWYCKFAWLKFALRKCPKLNGDMFRRVAATGETIWQASIAFCMKLPTKKTSNNISCEWKSDWKKREIGCKRKDERKASGKFICKVGKTCWNYLEFRGNKLCRKNIFHLPTTFCLFLSSKKNSPRLF